MVLLQLFNNKFILESREDMPELEQLCSYDDPDAQWRRKSITERADRTGEDISWLKDWNGSKKLYHKKVRVGYGGKIYQYDIPIGMLKSVQALISIDGNYDVIDSRFIKEESSIQDDHINMVELRNDEQEAGATAIRQSESRGIIEAVTGFGKTILGILAIQTNRLPTLIVANTLIIVQQWDEQIVKYFNLYRYKQGSTHIYTYNKHRGFDRALENIPDIAIMLSTNSTIWHVYFGESDGTIERNKLMKHWIDFYNDFLIYDEVHEAGSDTAIDVLDQITAYSRLGFSATVMSREDNKDLEYVARIGSIIYTRLNKHMREAKSIPLKFMKVKGIAFGRRTTYPEVYMRAVTENAERNETIIKLIDKAMDEDRRVLVLVEKLQHARWLSLMSGFPHTWASDKERYDKFDAFHDGSVPVMICTYKLVGVGYDHPMLDTVILAGAGRSKNKEVQAVGRIMRDAEGKKSKQVFDFADNCDKMRDQATERLNIWVNERVYKIDVRDTYLARYM